MLGHQASGAHQGDRVRTVMIPRADHLFTRLAHQQILTEHVVSWTKALASLANPEATSTMAVTDSAGAPSPTKGCAACRLPPPDRYTLTQRDALPIVGCQGFTEPP